MLLIDFTEEELKGFSKSWAWFLVWGFLLTLLGIVAIAYSGLTTLVSVEFLGCLLTITGGVHLIDTLRFWFRKSGFFIRLISSIIYLVVGLLFIINPVMGSLSLTVLLAISFIIIGSLRLYYSFALDLSNRMWLFFNGIITLLLGILILAGWPSSALFVLGLFIGIDLIIAGLSYMMAGLLTRKSTLKITHRHSDTQR